MSRKAVERSETLFRRTARYLLYDRLDLMDPDKKIDTSALNQRKGAILRLRKSSEKAADRIINCIDRIFTQN